MTAHLTAERAEPSPAVLPDLIPLNDIDALRAAGVAYPSTTDAWRWLYSVRVDRGLDDAFVRVGRHILVDVPRFRELLRAGS